MKYAVVTGGTRGIGKAISERLLREGYCVTAVYARNETAAQSFLEENKDFREQLKLIKMDISSAEAAQKLGDEIEKLLPGVDVLVCNSATTDFTAFGNVLPVEWTRVIDTNLTAPFFLIQRMARLITRESGRILLLGSYVAKYPHARSVSYGVSKAGVEMMTKYLVKYFGEDGITVNCISPGTINTAWHDEKTPEHRKRIEDKIALHRFGEPEEIAELCMAIIKNQYINGAVLDINGGYCYQ